MQNRPLRQILAKFYQKAPLALQNQPQRQNFSEIFIKKPPRGTESASAAANFQRNFSKKALPLLAANNRPSGKISAKKSPSAALNQPQRQNFSDIFIKKPPRCAESAPAAKFQQNAPSRRRIGPSGGEKIAQADGRLNNGKNSSLSRQKQRKLSKITDPINNITSKSSPLSTTHKNPFKHYSKPNTLLLARSITEASSEAR